MTIALDSYNWLLSHHELTKQIYSQAFVEHGPDPSIRKENNRTLLNLLANYSLRRLNKFLIPLGHNTDVNAKDSHKASPLHDAVEGGLLRICPCPPRA